MPSPRLWPVNIPRFAQYSRIYEMGRSPPVRSPISPRSRPRVMFYEDSFDLVDAGFFSMFSYPFVHGDPAKALRNPNSLVIREEVARKYFGDENPIGKTLTFNNRQDLVVSGVIRVPANSHLRPDFVALLDRHSRRGLELAGSLLRSPGSRRRPWLPSARRSQDRSTRIFPSACPGPSRSAFSPSPRSIWVSAG